MKNPLLLGGCLIFLCLILLCACGGKKQVKQEALPTTDSALVSLDQEEVKKRFGEPTSVSKTPENRLLWTYRPDWKLMPNDKGTIYLEFENGKVAKVIRAR
jgi:hypothetical protein